MIVTLPIKIQLTIENQVFQQTHFDLSDSSTRNSILEIFQYSKGPKFLKFILNLFFTIHHFHDVLCLITSGIINSTQMTCSLMKTISAYCLKLSNRKFIWNHNLLVKLDSEQVYRMQGNVYIILGVQLSNSNLMKG